MSNGVDIMHPARDDSAASVVNPLPSNLTNSLTASSPLYLSPSVKSCGLSSVLKTIWCITYRMICCVYNLHILKILIFEIFGRARVVFALWGSGVENRRSLANLSSNYVWV